MTVPFHVIGPHKTLVVQELEDRWVVLMGYFRRLTICTPFEERRDNGMLFGVPIGREAEIEMTVEEARMYSKSEFNDPKQLEARLKIDYADRGLELEESDGKAADCSADHP